MHRQILCLFVVVSFCACDPTSNISQTPSVYTETSHKNPITDSVNRLGATLSFQIPKFSTVDLEYRLNNKFTLQGSYSGTFGKYYRTGDDIVGMPKMKFAAGDFAGWYIHNVKKDNLLVKLGIGFGNTMSIVEPGPNDPKAFDYSGNFQRIQIVVGYQKNFQKNRALGLSWRQSVVNFKTYTLPDTAFNNKVQLLSDPQLYYQFHVANGFSIQFFLGVFLNGSDAGNRSVDHLVDTWRIQRGFMGLKAFYNWKARKD